MRTSISAVIAVAVMAQANAAMPISVCLDGDDVVATVPAGTLDETSALHLDQTKGSVTV